MSDESLFREVDEDVRQEQFKKLWARYGNLIMALCVLVIAGVAGYQGWKYWQARQADAAGENFFTAVALAESGKSDDALKQFEAVSHEGFAVLGKLREAGILAAKGQAPEAVSLYDAVAANGSVDATLRDLARVRAALALTDTASPADLAARLKPFDTAANPWRHTAREIMATALWRAKDYTSADKQVQAILADGETPGGVRQRAKILADLMAPLIAKK